MSRIAQVLFSGQLAMSRPAIGTTINIMASAESTKPRGKNLRALLRSLTVAIKNFAKAYATAFIASTVPRSPLVMAPAVRSVIDGIAIERFLRTI